MATPSSSVQWFNNGPLARCSLWAVTHSVAVWLLAETLQSYAFCTDILCLADLFA